MQVNGNQYIYTDISGLNDLKGQARSDQHAAIKDVAKQFESMFMGMMLKSMRDASMGDPIFDNNQSLVYRDMFDSQLALSLSKGHGMGLAEVLARQLSRQITGPSAEQGAAPSANPVVNKAAYQKNIGLPANTAQRLYQATPPPTYQPAPAATDATVDLSADIHSPQEKFIRKLWPMAEAAADELDTLPEVLIAQAALETGWGKYVAQNEQGVSSNNLFNIKAGPDWQGKTIEKTTLEYHHGVAVKEVARFRAYDSPAESFRDYVDFLKTHDRYGKALSEAADPTNFMHGLQRAGYATDPNYADKVLNIINREWDAINKTISLYEGAQTDA